MPDQFFLSLRKSSQSASLASDFPKWDYRSDTFPIGSDAALLRGLQCAVDHHSIESSKDKSIQLTAIIAIEKLNKNKLSLLNMHDRKASDGPWP
jgi:hypothetical protein